MSAWPRAEEASCAQTLVPADENDERVARAKRLPTLVFRREKRQSMAGLWVPMEKYERYARFSRCDSRDPPRGWSIRLTGAKISCRVSCALSRKDFFSGAWSKLWSRCVHVAFALGIARSIDSTTRSACAKADDSTGCERISAFRRRGLPARLEWFGDDFLRLVQSALRVLPKFRDQPVWRRSRSLSRRSLRASWWISSRPAATTSTL